MYDDLNTVIRSNGVRGHGGRFEEQPQGKASRTRTPKFDDTIYAIRQDMGLGREEEEEEEEESGGAAGNMSEFSCCVCSVP